MKLLKNIKTTLFSFVGRYSPYMDTYYFSKTDTILINKQKFFDYLKDWDELSDKQKTKQWEILKHLYDEKREE